jgi:hypothetical protein
MRRDGRRADSVSSAGFETSGGAADLTLRVGAASSFAAAALFGAGTGVFGRALSAFVSSLARAARSAAAGTAAWADSGFTV